MAINGILLREFTRDKLIDKLEEFLIEDQGYYDDEDTPKKLFQRKVKDDK